MPERIHGTAGAQQNLTSNLNTFTVYTSAPGAVTDPENTTGVDIRTTGDLSDESQKNFEVLVQSIGLRAMPVTMNDPQATTDLSLVGAPSLTGEGFRWIFSVEREDMFTEFLPNNVENDVGLLIIELNGIVLPSGVVLNTAPGGNIEFVRRDIV